MKILSRVCADFHDQKGNVIYRIRPVDRLVYKDDAPDAIRDDLLFKMLVADGSIEVIETAAQEKAMEQDPTAGADATGKKPPKTKADEKPAESQADQNKPEKPSK